MNAILIFCFPGINPATSCTLYDALLAGLEDYTVDERGDVGSWVRIACIRGLTAISERLLLHASALEQGYLPPQRYHDAIGGILRTGVERLDNVRQEAGTCFVRLLRMHPLSKDWEIDHSDYLKEILDMYGTRSLSVTCSDFSYYRDGESGLWSDGSWLFKKAVQFLEVSRYRKQVMRGLIVSLGSKTDSTVSSFMVVCLFYYPMLNPSQSIVLFQTA